MNWSQLLALLWLRWRLVLNHARRHGVVSFVLFVIFRIIFAVCSLIALAAGFLAGATWLPYRPVEVTMMVWSGAVMVYLLFTLINILVELQRSDLLSLNKLLHLPMTPSGAYLINYLGSSLNLNEMVFFAGMTGLTLGLLSAMGGVMVLLLPLVVVFFLMVTALVYQFRGWLASMMSNPRRRQTLVVIFFIGFMLVFLLPVVPDMIDNYHSPSIADASTTETVIEADGETGTRTSRERQRRQPWTPEQVFRLQTRVQFAGAILPPGWVVYGVVHTMEGRTIPALGCLLGMGLIGAWSLRRSYRTTLRLYQGAFDAVSGRDKTKTPRAPDRGRSNSNPRRHSSSTMRLPGVPERACAVAAASFRYLLRMPEMKLSLLSPLIMLLIFGGMLVTRKQEINEYLGTLQALGGPAFMLMISIVYLMTNQFAYDRAGFRALVLSPAPRRDILLGKNLGFFPFAFSLMILTIGLSQLLAPIQPDHLAAVTIQIIPIFLIYCLVGNTMSIYLPLVVKPDTAMPATGQNVKLLLRFVALMLSLLPLSLVLIPLGIEYLMYMLNWHTWFPAFLVFSLVQAGLAAWLYIVLLHHQAELLYRREQRILEVVTTRAE